MSFSGFKKEIEYGDTILLYIGYENFLPTVVTKKKVSQTKFGVVRHDQIIGKKYGTRYKTSKGFIHLIHPTPELWTQCLPHRTQILYSTDISMVIFQLDLKPGSIVVEAGKDFFRSSSKLILLDLDLVLVTSRYMYYILYRPYNYNRPIFPLN